MSLNKKNKGDRIAASEWNQVVDLVNKKQPFPNLEDRRNTSKTRYISVLATLDIPAYSVFGVANGGVDYIPFGSPLGLFTNDSLAIKSGAYGHARPINDYETTRLTRANSIGIGHPCGVKPNTFVIEANRYGFVCVSEIDDYLVEVVRVAEPCAIIGSVESKISRYDPRNKKPGSGYVKLLHRVSTRLSAAIDPHTQDKPWLFQVFNLGRQPIEDGLVICENVLGVGLVARRIADEESSSSGSSLSSFSTSEPGDECPDFEIIVAGQPFMSESTTRLNIPLNRIFRDQAGCLARMEYGTFYVNLCDIECGSDIPPGSDSETSGSESTVCSKVENNPTPENVYIQFDGIVDNGVGCCGAGNVTNWNNTEFTLPWLGLSEAGACQWQISALSVPCPGNEFQFTLEVYGSGSDGYVHLVLQGDNETTHFIVGPITLPINLNALELAFQSQENECADFSGATATIYIESTP